MPPAAIVRLAQKARPTPSFGNPSGFPVRRSMRMPGSDHRDRPKKLSVARLFLTTKTRQRKHTPSASLQVDEFRLKSFAPDSSIALPFRHGKQPRKTWNLFLTFPEARDSAGPYSLSKFLGPFQGRASPRDAHEKAESLSQGKSRVLYVDLFRHRAQHISPENPLRMPMCILI